MRLLLGLLLVAVSASAQNEFLNRNNSLAPIGGINMGAASTSSGSSVYTPNVFSTNKSTNTSSGGGIPDKPIEFTKPEFANPGDAVTEKLNHKEDNGDYRQFRQNQYLGDFKTTANTARISARDFGEVDGDQIKVLVNGRVMYEKVYLTGDYTTLELGLEKGFNKIEFEALNQGLVGPNTAQFRVTDEKGTIIAANQWNLATGFKASIILFKE